MKKILIIVLLFCSCKKDTQPKTWFEVKDRITETPIKGAVVNIFKCNPNDPWCGWIAWQSATTGDDGRCSFTTEDYNRVTFTNVTCAQYWGTSGSRSTSVRLFPEGWVRLRILRSAPYPSSTYLSLLVYGTDPNYISSKEVNAAADSTILVRCFGGQINRIEWRVMGANQLNSGTWNQQVPRLDTVAATLSY